MAESRASKATALLAKARDTAKAEDVEMADQFVARAAVHAQLAIAEAIESLADALRD